VSPRSRYAWQVGSKRCPVCGLVNPEAAERCDCGRSFVDGSQAVAELRGTSLAERKRSRTNALATLASAGLCGFVASHLSPFTPLGIVVVVAAISIVLAITGVVMLIRARPPTDR
jgi:hypothetical protein